MQSQVEELYSLLVPLHQGRLIVPRSCISEVIRYSPAEQARSGPDWFRGYVQWSDQRIPVVRMEDLCGLEPAEPGGRTRLAIFSCLSDVIEGGAFGLLTEGFPQLVRVNREVMEVHDENAWPDNGPIICQIRMINEYPLIPDLERLEELIAERMAEAA
ncbi:MAG: chemotaxis protein CheW [Gammaproteobacteria bacterium]|nr:MAG: chemotaxis protein CheW [Gammaproteobacteria bacterium]